MQKELLKLASAQPGNLCSGFRLVKKEPVAALDAVLYTLVHEKTRAQLLYLDRADENRTFAICFKTLPENDTGVFHILEHSVLNGSRRFPVKEPFVSLLQSSMQTFLNALTFGDKTVYPVSSRNEKDLFNLMSVYLDAVFDPLIYEKPEIFLQEGWHFEPGKTPGYNGVVYSEMKGAFADVDTLMQSELSRLLYPDTSDGFVSGGHPEHIPELSWEQFVATHRRFYHPSNARIFLDGHMQIDEILRYIDEEYLSKYDYRAPDFDFSVQKPTTGEKTILYEAREGEETLAHMAAAKILCSHKDVETIYAAKILADYLTGSNEAPLTRAFLERGLAQDVSLQVEDGVFQPNLCFLARNTVPEKFAEIRETLAETARSLVQSGLDREALAASLERFAFRRREISEPYGVTLALRALDGWLYGDDPLTHIDSTKIFDSLRDRLDSDYFPKLLQTMLADAGDKVYLYALPSTSKGREDAQREAARAQAQFAALDGNAQQRTREAVASMQRWQQTPDSEEALCSLPHLELADVPQEAAPIRTREMTLDGAPVLEVDTQSGGIAYLNLYFDVSDFSLEELRLLNTIAACFGELSTSHYDAKSLQTRVKVLFGHLNAGIDMTSKPGDLRDCTPYLHISAAMLEENAPEALALLTELLTNGRYDETDRILETVRQLDYLLKQNMIESGHMLALSKALSAFSAEAACKEQLTGEAFVQWFGQFAASFAQDAGVYAEKFAALMAKACAKNRLFAGYCGKLDAAALGALVSALPEHPLGVRTETVLPDAAPCAIEIPGDVGFTAIGHNLYALGETFTGAWAVASSLMTFDYLWSMVRLQGGAYGTGMNVRLNGDMFCYSYRDPAPEGTRAAYAGMTDFLQDALAQKIPLDDLIIGTVNTTDPLLDPSGVCDVACIRRLKGITVEDIARVRREILTCTPKALAALTDTLRAFSEHGKFCAVGNPASTAFVHA